MTWMGDVPRVRTADEELGYVRRVRERLDETLRLVVELRQERDAAIARAVDAGCRLADVAKMAGLSRYEASRVGERARRMGQGGRSNGKER